MESGSGCGCVTGPSPSGSVPVPGGALTGLDDPVLAEGVLEGAALDASAVADGEGVLDGVVDEVAEGVGELDAGGVPGAPIAASAATSCAVSG